jgi:hypothetical protein
VPQRRSVRARDITFIGKEANKLLDVQDGTVHELADVLTAIVDCEHDPWRALVLPVLRRMSRADLRGRSPGGATAMPQCRLAIR